MSLRMGSLLAAAAVCAACASIAAAAYEGSATITLTPDRAGSASSLSVSAHGPFGSQGAPTAIRLLAAPGFASSARSVARLCTAAEENADSCPAASRIGSGSAVATGTLATTSVQDHISFIMYLGSPLVSGDIASIHITGSDTALHQSARATGRLLQAGGRLEILFKPLPQFTPPPGTRVTLDSLSLQAGASRTVLAGAGARRRRTTFSLITNPRRCPRAGWSSTLVVSFASGDDTVRTLNAPCQASPPRRR